MTCTLKHIQDDTYRDHELSLYYCSHCDHYTLDVRSDNYDGPMLAGFRDKSLMQLFMHGFQSVDKHEIDKLLSINIPF